MTTQTITVIQVSRHDREATARFYGDIFGWQIHHEADYTWFEAPAVPKGDQATLPPFLILVDSGAAKAYSRTA